jgi:CHAT domain-containing protein
VPTRDTESRRNYHFALGSIFVHRVLGQPGRNVEQAIRHLSKAREHIDKLGHPQKFAESTAYLGVAYIWKLEGDWSENIERGIELLEEAQEVQERIGPPDAWAATTADIAIAFSLRQRGEKRANMERALELIQQAARVRDRSANPSGWASTMLNVGALWSERIDGDPLQNQEQALQAYDAVLAHYRAEGDFYHAARVAGNMASVLYSTHSGDRIANLRRAVEVLEAAIPELERVRADFDVTVAQLNRGLSLHRLARMGVENPERASAALAVALDSALALGVPQLIRQAAHRSGLAYLEADNLRGAAASFRIAVDTERELVGAGSLRETRIREIERSGGLYHLAALVEADLGDLSAALELIKLGRTRELVGAAVREQADLAKLVALSPSLATELTRIRAGLSRISLTELQGPVVDSQFVRLSNTARKYREELADVLKRVREVHGLETFEMPMEGADWQIMVGVGAPIVAVVVTTYGCFAILAERLSTDAPVELRRIPMPDELTRLSHLVEPVDNAVGYFEAIAGRSAEIGSALDTIWPLAEMVMQSIFSELEKRSSIGVTILAAGLLSLVPLHAAACVDQDGNRVVFQSRFPTAYTLNLLPSSQREADGQHSLLAVANPRRQDEYSLRGARVEVDAVASYFADGQRTVLAEANANLGAVLAIARGATHIHFACHGTFSADSPLDSALLLAGDQQLTVRDVLSSTSFVNARLVVLSACRTAAIEHQRLPDEALGFPAAFLKAGAGWVIASLWAIDDVASALLVANFYQTLLAAAPASPADAARALAGAADFLRTATAKELYRWVVDWLANPPNSYVFEPGHWEAVRNNLLRMRETTQPYADPKYWAAYVLITGGGT